MNPITMLWVRVLAVVLAVVALLAGFAYYRASLIADGVDQGTQAERAVWVKAESDRKDREAAERDRLDKQKEESDRETHRLTELAQDHRAAADAAAGKLRNDLATFVAAAKSPSSAAVGERPAADTALDLLAGLFNRADARAGDLAEYADRARIAGQQCERDYDALRSSR